MLDLDKCIDSGFEIKLFEKKVTLKQLTYEDVVKIGKLETEMSKEGIKEEVIYINRAKITQIFLNNNAEGVKFDLEKIKNSMPVKLQVALGNEVAKFIYRLEKDPN